MLERPVAVKMAAAAAGRLNRPAPRGPASSHPGPARRPVFDYGETDGFLVMEYVDGMPLSGWQPYRGATR